MKIPELSESTINKAIRVLNEGGIVIFPTDTVYGIGCRIDRQEAISRIYKIKGTSKNQPFPILVSDIASARKLADVNQAAQRLVDKYWPGALTIILRAKFPKGNPKGGQTLGFRIPDSKLLKSIIKNTGPIIGTSANFHGQKTPASYEELDNNFIKLADFVIKGECNLKHESTVIDATVNPPKVQRQGALKIDDFKN